MKNHIFYKLASILAVSTLIINSVQAQQVRTGTNLNSKAIPSQILMLQTPDEVENIRHLLLDGKKNDALKAAEIYLVKVDSRSLRHETLPKYYAWNAYCTVLTSLHRVEEAIAACTTAMEIEPGKWSAVNNRGTAKLIGGRLQDALSDYQTAISMTIETSENVRETIQHNISLAMERQ
jgi:tetratricopeptide (TPR) repeat protein